MPLPLAILASSRSHGHTATALTRLLQNHPHHLIDLNTTQITPFNYNQTYPPTDAFTPIINQMITAPITIFATPVYWYSFSTVMKNFLDRLSDLLMSNKDLGRQLRGTRWALLSTGADPHPDPDLTSAFRRTCHYLGIECIATLYAIEDGDFTDDQAAALIQSHLT